MEYPRSTDDAHGLSIAARDVLVAVLIDYATTTKVHVPDTVRAAIAAL